MPKFYNFKISKISNKKELKKYNVKRFSASPEVQELPVRI